MAIAVIDHNDPKLGAKLVESFRQTGFAILKDPFYPNLGMVKDVYNEWRVFFEKTSQEQKNNHLFKVEEQAGYYPMLSEGAKGAKHKDIKEFYHYYPWYQNHPRHLEDTHILYRVMSSLGCNLLELIEQNTPEHVRKDFSIPLSEMAKDAHRTMLRILHYPPLTGSEEPGAVRAAEHEDINLITLLPMATADGLQVKDVNGNWHNAECEGHCIVINVGDMLQLASNGYYPSTTHRVVNPEGEAAKQRRYSMPLFIHAKDDVLLAPNKTANQYLLERLKELGLL